MRSKIPITASITILTVLMAVPLATPQAQASNGSPATDPSNLWYPYGPSTRNVLVHFYNGQSQELQAFELGQLDMVDLGFLDGVPPPKWASYTANPNFLLSPVQGSEGYFMINMNLMSNRFKAWGCDWANGNSQCGIDMRESFAHLVDRQQWVIDGPLNGAGQALADPTWPATTPSGSPLSEQCSWDSLPQYHDNCTFAFHFGPPCAGGFCTDPSQPDFCAAVSYMIQADIDSGNQIHLARDNSAPMDQFGFHCGLDISSSNIGSNHILAFIRNNDANRLALGNGFRSALNFLFGTNVVDATYGTLAQARPIVFRDGFTKGAALWDWYTGGTGAAGPYPAHLYGFYNGLFASDACGGQPLLAPRLNYLLACVPSLDADTAAAINAGDVSTFIAATLRAFHDYGSHVVDLPAFTGGSRTVALKSAAGLVNQLGFGYNNFYSLLSAHSDGTSTGPFAFGGGDPNILRYGLSGGTESLNMFKGDTLPFQSENDIKIISEIYDSLFASNPVEPGQFFCWMCNSFNQFVDPNGNTHVDVELRQGLRWQDGVPVTAHDIAFSLYYERDFGFLTGLQGIMLNQTSVLSNTQVDIVMSGVSFEMLGTINMALITPSHIWELKSGAGSAGTPQAYSPDHSVGIVDPAKSSPSYDPMTAHTLIGSGPFACIDLNTGAVGGGCALTAAGTPSGQAIPAGGTMLLTRYDFTSTSVDPFNQWMRTYNLAWGTGSDNGAHSGQFQEFSWADRFNNDTVTIQDLASVAACSGLSAPAFACPVSDSSGPVFSYWLKPSFHSGMSRVGSEVAIVASHLDDTWVFPFSWSGDQGSQPGQPLENIVPFTP